MHLLLLPLTPALLMQFQPMKAYTVWAWTTAAESKADIKPPSSFSPPSMQISCASSSTELANRVRFRYYFQMLGSDADLAPTYFGVIQYYGWKRIGLIVQNENLFTVVRNNTVYSKIHFPSVIQCIFYFLIPPFPTSQVCVKDGAGLANYLFLILICDTDYGSSETTAWHY